MDPPNAARVFRPFRTRAAAALLRLGGRRVDCLAIVFVAVRTSPHFSRALFRFCCRPIPFSANISCGTVSRRRTDDSALPFEGYRVSSIQLGKVDKLELSIATDDFDPANKIGQGGFGSVYKGRLNGSLVAIKVLSAESRQGTKEFLAEINVISEIEHENLVKFHGCCIERRHRMLVYGYLENNSLAQTLLGGRLSSIHFSWNIRSKICIGIARGLAYLHEEVEPHIVHRDIKASNVLLDKDLNPKISDFGLAKLLPADMTHVSTRVAGTMGYLAPEYALRGQLNRKADIYAFGVLIMEIVCGRSITNKALPFGEQYLLEKVWDLYNCHELETVVDSSLNGNYNDVEAACRFLKIGLLCTQEFPKLRPVMSAALKMLTGEMEVDDRKITRPGFISDLKDLKVKTAGGKSRGKTPLDMASGTSQETSSSRLNARYLLLRCGEMNTCFPRAIRASISPASLACNHLTRLRQLSVANHLPQQSTSICHPSTTHKPRTPLFLRPLAQSATLADLQKFHAWARNLIFSRGSHFESADNGPGTDILLRELRWLLEDAAEDSSLFSLLGASQNLVFSQSDSYCGEASTNSFLGSSKNPSFSTSNSDFDYTSAASFAGVCGSGRTIRLKAALEDLYSLWEERIEKRRPFQYIVGCEHWRDLVLSVEEGVLIPRPETELIVDMVSQVFVNDPGLKEGVWADLGTGSGAIGVGIARILGEGGRVIATDVSNVAVAVASYNVERYGLQDKIEARQGFWFDPLQDVKGKVTGLVSNPPYIPSHQISGLQAEVGRHEPRTALDGGRSGMDDLLHLCKGSALVLKRGGFFAFETNGDEQSEFIADFMSNRSENCFRDVKIESDYAGIGRFVTGFYR
ncbi:hypothetical protein ACLOJK_021699 [Asimina triloba]